MCIREIKGEAVPVKHIVFLDYLRAIACVMVITIHGLGVFCRHQWQITAIHWRGSLVVMARLGGVFGGVAGAGGV